MMERRKREIEEDTRPKERDSLKNEDVYGK